MGVCQNPGPINHEGFENIDKVDQTQRKNPIIFQKMKLFSLSNKNSETISTKHGPRKADGQYTGVAYIQLTRNIENILQQPIKYPDHDIHGKQDHEPFLFFRKNQIYHGQWQDGVPHGIGKSYNINKKAYFEGIFNQHIPSVFGRFANDNGVVYVGEISHGRANGHGTYEQSNIVINGTFKDSQPHGQCTEKSNNYSYDGQFQNGKWTGKSKLVYNNKQCTYTGQFENGLFHGYGVHVTPDFTYEGHFKNGRRSGTGSLQNKDGSVYKGQFYQDLPEGNGIMTHNGLVVYKGEWNEGRAHGIGDYNYRSKILPTGWDKGKATCLI